MSGRLVPRFTEGQRVKAAASWAGLKAGETYTVEAVAFWRFADVPAEVVKINGEWIACLEEEPVATPEARP